MKKTLFLFAILSVALFSCKKEDVKTQPTADFTYFETGGKVTFTNLSSNYDYSEWKFGDGADHYIDEPEHTYSQNGTYTVQLLAGNYNGLEDTKTKQITVSGVTATATSGQYLIWISTADYGEITVKINGGNVGKITAYSTSGLAPSCGTAGFITIDRPAGNYTLTATSTSGGSWETTLNVVNGQCKKLQLT